ncbi:MAG: signal recognition particle receptor subunit alpha [Alphaproteobacteria bacterium]|nr:signal recognition particle receptor subunit alpha [Alphaproteobacteria bacterium]
MFSNLGEKLRKLASGWQDTAVLKEKDLDKALKDIRLAFLEADVALSVTDDFIGRIKESLSTSEYKTSLTAFQSIIQSVFAEIKKTLGEAEPLNISDNLNVITLVGLQGVGKTTSTAKLAAYLTTTMKKKVLLVSLDVYRPAAREQLKILGEQISVDVVHSEQSDVEKIFQEAFQVAKQGLYDVLLVDTAGRTHIDTKMMEELALVHKISKSRTNILVADAMLGQESVTIASAFHKAVPLTGLLLTRVDGDARGGAALSMRAVTGVPIQFLGVGEKIDAFETFNPDRIARRILGMGDTLALVEKITQEEKDEDEFDFSSSKSFNYNDLLKQMKKITKLGGVKKIMQFLPKSFSGAQLPDVDENEKKIKRQMAIILSMTPQERLERAPLNSSRKKRIVSGAGVTIQEVNQMVKQLKTMRTMMKRMGKQSIKKTRR